MRNRVLSLAVVGALMAASIFTEASASTKLTYTLTQTASQLGYTFKDWLIINDSFYHREQFYFVTNSQTIVQSCYVTCGFKDGATQNYDWVQIPTNNGMTTGQYAYAKICNSNGTTAKTNTVYNNISSSSKAQVVHTGTNVKYICVTTF